MKNNNKKALDVIFISINKRLYSILFAISTFGMLVFCIFSSIWNCQIYSVLAGIFGSFFASVLVSYLIETSNYKIQNKQYNALVNSSLQKISMQINCVVSNICKMFIGDKQLNNVSLSLNNWCENLVKLTQQDATKEMIIKITCISSTRRLIDYIEEERDKIFIMLKENINTNEEISKFLKQKYQLNISFPNREFNCQDYPISNLIYTMQSDLHNISTLLSLFGFNVNNSFRIKEKYISYEIEGDK